MLKDKGFCAEICLRIASFKKMLIIFYGRPTQSFSYITLLNEPPNLFNYETFFKRHCGGLMSSII